MTLDTEADHRDLNSKAADTELRRREEKALVFLPRGWEREPALAGDVLFLTVSLVRPAHQQGTLQ